jgi:integrase/recombinase XerD
MSATYEVDETRLFNAEGQRKYLIPVEAKRYLAAAAHADRPTRLFAQLLYLTGCRLSEGLAITPKLIDVEGQRVVFRTLKRRKLLYRAVPVPTWFLRELVAYASELEPEERLFPWCRQTGWRRIRALMDAASIEGPQASPKGLRHQFGCQAIGQKIPESAVGRWLGHASPKSTRVYTFAVGAEERALAERMW